MVLIQVGTSVTYTAQNTNQERNVKFFRDNLGDRKTIEARVYTLASDTYLFTVKGDHCFVGSTKLSEYLNQNIFLNSKKTAREEISGVEKRLFFTYIVGSLEAQ